MTLEEVRAIFVLAEIPVKAFHQLANGYWPDSPEYDDIRRSNPWWLAVTEFGLIRIGWRKRVISIEWEDTPVRTIVTKDEVSKDEQMVHAWSHAKAVEYLSQWRKDAQAAVDAKFWADDAKFLAKTKEETK
jgi:hypothetical protein